MSEASAGITVWRRGRVGRWVVDQSKHGDQGPCERIGRGYCSPRDARSFERVKRGEGLPYGEGDGTNDWPSTDRVWGPGSVRGDWEGVLLAREPDRCLNERRRKEGAAYGMGEARVATKKDCRRRLKNVARRVYVASRRGSAHGDAGSENM